jgi:hypothetical protein
VGSEKTVPREERRRMKATTGKMIGGTVWRGDFGLGEEEEAIFGDCL